MKRGLAKVLVICLVFGALSSRAWGGDAGDAATRKEAQAFLDKVAAMFDKKDVAGLAKTCVPGATLRYANGKEVTIEEWKKTTEKEFAGMATMRSKFKVEKVVVKGDSKIVTYKEMHDYTLSGEKKNKYRSVSRWSVTLTKTPQGLLATHFVEFSEKNTRNGKPFTPKTTPM